jgi:hypothetical protein
MIITKQLEIVILIDKYKLRNLHITDIESTNCYISRILIDNFHLLSIDNQKKMIVIIIIPIEYVTKDNFNNSLNCKFNLSIKEKEKTFYNINADIDLSSNKTRYEYCY